MKLKNKIIKWLGGYTEKQINVNLYDEISYAAQPLRPLTYAAKTIVRQSTIDIFGLENVMSAVKKELAEKIVDKVFETSNLVKYEQEKDNNENVIITARLTLYAEENK